MPSDPAHTPADPTADPAADRSRAGSSSGSRVRAGLTPGGRAIRGSAALSELASSCDLLVDLVDTLAEIDRLTAHATQVLERGQLTQEVEEHTGVGLELWLSVVGRRTSSDRRMLATAADARRRMPTVASAFDRGVLSWSQVRALVLAVAKLPGHVVTQVDEALAGELEVLSDAEPDALLHLVRQVVDACSTTAGERDEREAVAERFVAIQPRLDGRGGSLYGELDAVGLAVVSEALDAATPPTDVDGRGFGAARDPGSRRDVARSIGARRADRLVSLCARALASGETGADAAPVPQLVCTMSVETLLGLDDAPGELLTRLTGGRLKVAGPTARRLIQHAGARLRSVVLDETGQVLGVGRASRVPPGWLADAIRVRDRECREPGCQVSARVAALDHGRPWHPAGDDVAGRTDVENLAALCRSSNHRKERDGWVVHGLPDGRRRHRHRRSGLRVDTLPATRRLPGVLPPADPHHGRTRSFEARTRDPVRAGPAP